MSRVMVVLAGGEATRLGPLTAQMSKALVSVKQRPMIAHHVATARAWGADEMVVVTSPASRLQVERVLERLQFPFRIVVQPMPIGPVGAIALACQAMDMGDDALVTAADTLITDRASMQGDRWIGVSYTEDTSRSWCYPGFAGFEDGLRTDPGLVFVGAFSALVSDITTASFASEDLTCMSEFLNRLMPVPMREVHGWHDVGDLEAMANTTRALFTSRDKHTITLDDRGVLTKTGVDEQAKHAAVFFEKIMLGPRIISTAGDSLSMEHVPLPSLAELYLYWPGGPQTWAHILDTLLAQMEKYVWSTSSYCSPCNDAHVVQPRHAQREMYIEKMIDRQQSIGQQAPADLIAFLHEEVIGGTITLPSRVHGDLNFGNILYSLGTDTFKLIDARGDWGGNCLVGDKRYDAAKLRFSYKHGLTAISHGLKPEPDRPEVAHMDRVLEDHGFNLKHLAAIAASAFYSSMPLHDPSERPDMRAAAELATEEALS